MKTVRLDKYLSDTTDYTRSEIRRLIRRGMASVNGEIIREFDAKIDTNQDVVVFCGEKTEFRKFVYLMLNKPAGILSASNDKSRETVVDILPDNYKKYGLFPVGRLDKDTTGLLFLTNDGEFAHKVISPKNNIEKSYIAVVDGEPRNDMVANFKNGVVLADDTVCKSAKFEILGQDKVRIVLTEGKYHQIKRMLGTVGLGVVSLHRERIGCFTLPNDLKSGEVRDIEPIMAVKLFNIDK